MDLFKNKNIFIHLVLVTFFLLLIIIYNVILILNLIIFK